MSERAPKLKAPFPWYGGKSRVSHLVWPRFGADVPNYVEPFAGSLAVLLGRPGEAKTETVNDLNCYVANFWRATQWAPDAVAHWADWPVNEADLHARHRWLVNKLTERVPDANGTPIPWRRRLRKDPDFYDAQVAGWWVWGISQWIGGGWCAQPDWEGRTLPGRSKRGVHSAASLEGRNATVPQQLPAIATNGGGGSGILRKEFSQKMPQLSGDGSGSGRGVFCQGISQNLAGYIQALSDRLRRTRVCCGDWQRILGPSPTTCIGTTAVFLDPPYSDEERDAVYTDDSFTVAKDVAAWCREHGQNPKLRIALCGYAGEHDLPGWEEVAWKANGGYGNQAKARGRANAHRERIWFSPHCLRPDREPELFEIESGRQEDRKETKA